MCSHHQLIGCVQWNDCTDSDGTIYIHVQVGNTSSHPQNHKIECMDTQECNEYQSVLGGVLARVYVPHYDIRTYMLKSWEWPGDEANGLRSLYSYAIALIHCRRRRSPTHPRGRVERYLSPPPFLIGNRSESGSVSTRRTMSSQTSLRVILGTMEMGRGSLCDDSPVSRLSL